MSFTNHYEGALVQSFSNMSFTNHYEGALVQSFSNISFTNHYEGALIQSFSNMSFTNHYKGALIQSFSNMSFTNHYKGALIQSFSNMSFTNHYKGALIQSFSNMSFTNHYEGALVQSFSNIPFTNHYKRALIQSFSNISFTNHYEGAPIFSVHGAMRGSSRLRFTSYWQDFPQPTVRYPINTRERLENEYCLITFLKKPNPNRLNQRMLFFPQINAIPSLLFGSRVTLTHPQSIFRRQHSSYRVVEFWKNYRSFCFVGSLYSRSRIKVPD